MFVVSGRTATEEDTMGAITTTGRVGKGKKVHAISENHADCGASFRKGFGKNRPVSVTGEQIDCLHCIRIHKLDAPAAPAAAAPAAPAKCANAPIVELGRGRLYGHCGTCGKEGKVATGGRIRAHFPLAA
jgi:hypothetical protein